MVSFPYINNKKAFLNPYVSEGEGTLQRGISNPTSPTTPKLLSVRLHLDLRWSHDALGFQTLQVWHGLNFHRTSGGEVIMHDIHAYMHVLFKNHLTHYMDNDDMKL